MAGTKSGTLLVVDDEAEIREIIELHATALGYKVLEAGDGLMALEVIREHHVDVIISDLMMPRMTGLTLLTSLRREGYTQPFIFVTAYPSQDSTLQALRLGAFDYVEKPFAPDELEALISEAMRVSREIQKIGPAGPAPVPVGKDEKAAAKQIQKLRALRYSTDETGAVGPEAKREKLHELFVAETTPQLLFCEAAIKGMSDVDQRAIELGYLFRVSQAIAAAAEAIGESVIKDVADHAARFYTVLRVRPRAVSPEAIELAHEANVCLRLLVTEAGQGTVAGAQAAAKVRATLEEATRTIEEGRALIAS